MKLIEYLKSQKCKTPEDCKLLIFDKINTEITRKSIFSRISFYAKVSVYSFLMFFFFLGIFLPSLKDNKGNVDIELKTDSVYAENIGKIIKSEGEVEIYGSNGKVKSNLITKGSIISLKDNSYVKLLIDSGINVYLVGPAKIKVDLTKKEGQNTYTVYILDGDYMTVKSNSLKDNLVIKSKYLNLEAKDKFVDIKYEEKKGIGIIKNDGGNLLVKNNDTVVNVNKKELIMFLDNDDKKYISNLFGGDYTKYQLNSDGGVKKILSSTNLRKLGETIDREKVMLGVGEYVLGKLNNNKELEEKGLKDLLNVTLNTYEILNIKIPHNLQDDLFNNKLDSKLLSNLINNLIKEIDKLYIVPNIYQTRLKIVLVYMLITDKIKNKNIRYKNLSEVVNHLKISDNYKKILLTF